MAVAATTTAVDPGILLEAGTNEVEILVFKVAGQLCGVNVAKVREVRTHQTPIFLPQAPDAVDGVVRIRDAVVPLVNLRQMLWGAEAGCEAREEDEHLLLEFNDQMVAFRVQGVDRIHRVSWKSFIPLPHSLGANAPVTGIILIESRIVTVLDFEAIGGVLGVNGTPPEIAVADATADAAPTRPPIVFADDSQLIRRMLDDSLSQAGYKDRRGFGDGQAAWDYLDEVARGHTAETLHETVAGVISDIEMPRMDGFTLTRRIRENPILKDLPVVLFSSLISKDNENKGRQVGATAQISKPRWEELTATLMNVLGEIVR
jgi:two-component system, chemotaxis family, chemotaxis protein CheV